MTEKLLVKWAEEFQLETEALILSLSHCAFELGHLGLEQEKGIKSPVNWFYKRLQDAGYYAAPAGYKSRRQLALEELQNRLAKGRRPAEHLPGIQPLIPALRTGAGSRVLGLTVGAGPDHVP